MSEAVRNVLNAAQDVDGSEFAPDYGPDAPDGLDLPDDRPPVEICASLPLNDFGNGQRFQIHFGGRALWVARVGWFLWTGQYWRGDPDANHVRAWAQQISKLIADEVRYITAPPPKVMLIERKDQIDLTIADLSKIKSRNDDQDSALALARSERAEIDKILARVQDEIGQRLGFAKTTGNSGRITNLLQESCIGLARDISELDAAPLDINAANGVLRFALVDHFSGVGKSAQVTVIPHDQARDFLMTKMMAVAYDPDATCPRFDAFLEQIQPDPQMRAFLMRWFGLNMTALTGEQKLCFFYGMGANGKSVLVDLMSRILGDYAATAKIESLTGTNRRGGGDATPDLVPLIGARMVRASEPDQNVQWQEGLIKDLTGGEKIMVRALHSDFVEVQPKFKLQISGNHKPDIRGTDDGIWRRLLLVPFDVQIPPSERIAKDQLDAMLFSEASGILNRLIAGLLDYMTNGLQEPRSIVDATEEFRESSDPYGSFLNDACVVTGDAADSVPSRDLILAFNFWLARAGAGQFKERTISLQLADRAKRWHSKPNARGEVFKFTARKSGTMFYDGIRFTDIFKKAFDAAPRDAQGRILMTRDVSLEG